MSDVGGAPAGFPAPPAWGGPPTGAEPRPRRRRRWPWVLGGVLVLIIGLGATGGTLFVQKIKPVIDASNQFLRDVERGNGAAAFDQLCDRDRELLDEEFVELLTVADFEVNPFDVSINGDRATVGFDVEGLGQDEKLELPLRKEGGTWRPCLTDDPELRDLGELRDLDDFGDFRDPGDLGEIRRPRAALIAAGGYPRLLDRG